MKAKVIKIGNSKGVRLPRTVLEEVGLQEEVILEASRGTLVIRPAGRPRSGWRAAFQDMAKAGDDKMLEFGPPVNWDDQEWEWK